MLDAFWGWTAPEFQNQREFPVSMRDGRGPALLS